MKIIIFKKSTNQKLILNEINSKIGFNEINEALKIQPYPNSIGLVSPEFTITIIRGNNRKEFKVFDRGYVILNTEDNKYYLFKYGNTWHEKLQKNLNKLLDKNPKYFLTLNKNTKVKPSLGALIVSGIAKSSRQGVKKNRNERTVRFMAKALTGSLSTTASTKTMKKASAKKASRTKKDTSKVGRRVLVKKAAKKKK